MACGLGSKYLRSYLPTLVCLGLREWVRGKVRCLTFGGSGTGHCKDYPWGIQYNLDIRIIPCKNISVISIIPDRPRVLYEDLGISVSKNIPGPPPARFLLRIRVLPYKCTVYGGFLEDSPPKPLETPRIWVPALNLPVLAKTV
jgi:hypothetical protein